MSTATAACEATPFVPDQSGFTTFGMGFSHDERIRARPSTSRAAAPRRRPPSPPSTRRRSRSTWSGSFRPTILNAELTGTGAGDLFAFYATQGAAPCNNMAAGVDCTDSAIGQIDKATGQVTAQTVLRATRRGRPGRSRSGAATSTRSPRPAPATIVNRFSPATARSSRSRRAPTSSWAPAFPRALRRVEGEARRHAAGLVSFVGAGPGNPGLRTAQRGAAPRGGRRGLRGGRRPCRAAHRAGPRRESGSRASSPAIPSSRRRRSRRCGRSQPQASPSTWCPAWGRARRGVGLRRSARARGPCRGGGRRRGARERSPGRGGDDHHRRGRRRRSGSLTTTAGEGAARARELGDGPVILAFGAPEEALRWAERRPLFGKRVLVTRARDQAGSTAALLRELRGGARRGAHHRDPPAEQSGSARDGARYPPRRRRTGGSRSRAPTASIARGTPSRPREAMPAPSASTQLAAIGPATARALERHGVKPDVVAREFRGEALADGMLSTGGPSGLACCWLAPRAPATCCPIPCARPAGRSTSWPPTRPALHRAKSSRGSHASSPTGRIDAVTFTSSSTVDNLCDRLGADAVRLLAGPRIASIGPVTTVTALGRGLRVDVTARQYTVPGPRRGPGGELRLRTLPGAISPAALVQGLERGGTTLYPGPSRASPCP